jgi:hypothetical protein
VSCYLLQETDGSKFELEDDSGFLLLEFCPDGGEYNPIGDRSPALPLADLSDALPVRRGRRRRREVITDEEILISVLLDEL